MENETPKPEDEREIVQPSVESPSSTKPKPKKTVELNIATRKNGNGGYGAEVVVVEDPAKEQQASQQKEPRAEAVPTSEQRPLGVINGIEIKEVNSREDAIEAFLGLLKEHEEDRVKKTGTGTKKLAVQASIQPRVKELEATIKLLQESKDITPGEKIISEVIKNRKNALKKYENSSPFDSEIFYHINATMEAVKSGGVLSLEEAKNFKSYLDTLRSKAKDSERRKEIDSVQKEVRTVIKSTPKAEKHSATAAVEPAKSEVSTASVEASKEPAAEAKKIDRIPGESEIQYNARIARINLGIDKATKPEAKKTMPETSPASKTPLEAEPIEAPVPVRAEKGKTVKSGEKKSEGRELPELKDALDKKYPWAKIAEKTRKSLSRSILESQRILEEIEKGVPEKTPEGKNNPLHKKIQKLAKEISEKNEGATRVGLEVQQGDFFDAIEQFKTIETARLRMLNSEWTRLVALSLIEAGANDEELKALAEANAEEMRKNGKTPDSIKCNDKARAELLGDIKSKFKDEDIKKILEEEAAEKIRNLKTELERTYTEIVDVQKSAAKGKEQIEVKKKRTAELSDKAETFAKSLKGEGFSLKQETYNEAKKEVEGEGFKVVDDPKAWKAEKTEPMKKAIMMGERRSAIKEYWNRMSQEEKNQYIEGGKINEKKVVSDVNLQIQKTGLSEQVFYRLINEGYRPEKMIKRGFWGKIFGSAIEIPSASENRPSIPLSQTKFEKWKISEDSRVTTAIANEANVRLDRRIKEGQAKWQQRNKRKFGEIIKKIVSSVS